MFLAKKRGVLYLGRGGLVLYQPGSSSAPKLDFSPDAVGALEIINAQRFGAQLQSFIQNSKLGPLHVVIVLGEDVYFQKIISQTEPAKQQIEVQSFLDEVPLDPQRIAAKIVMVGGRLIALATNKGLYEFIVSAFEQQKWKVLAVIPAIIFPGITSSNLSPQTAGEILGSKSLIRKSNLLAEKSQAQRRQPTASKWHFAKWQIAILAGLIIVSLAIIVIAITLGLAKG